MRIKNFVTFSLLTAYSCVRAANVPEGVKLASEQTLRIDLGFEPKQVHPHYESTLYESWVVNDLFEALISEDAKGKPVPGAAIRWEANEDYTVWTFHLRPEAKWSNGDSVTAEDFVYSARTLLMSDSRKAKEGETYSKLKNAGAVKKGVLPSEALGIQSMDPHTLQITLQSPEPFFPERSGNAIYPLHKASAMPWSTGNDIAVPKIHVTNGAYCNLVYVTNLKYQAERNPYYWDNAHTVVDRVEYYFTEDIAVRQERFLQDKMDLSLLISQASGLEAQYVAKFKERFKQTPSTSQISVALNVNEKPLNNLKVRQALNMVIDREAMLKYLKQPKSLPIYSQLHPGAVHQPLIQPEWVSWSYEKRVAEARKKIAELKLPIIKMICSATLSKTKLPAYLAEVWKETLGIEVRVLEMDFQTILQKRRNKDFVMQIRGATHVNPSFAYSFLGSFTEPASENSSNYYNSRLAGLLEAACVPTLTLQEREALLLQANCLLAEEGPVLSLFYRTKDYLVQPYVGGIDSDNLIGRFKAKDLYLIDSASTEYQS